MKHTTFARISVVALPLLLGSSAGLRADDSIQIPWNDLCKAANGRQLTLVTNEGETVTGYCLAVDANGISLNAATQRVTLARTTVAKIRALPYASNRRHLRALGRNLRGGLQQGVQWIFSEWAPLGIVTIPAVLAWSAASAPFCLLNDLAVEDASTQTIRVQ